VIFNLGDETVILTETRNFVNLLNVVYDVQPTHLRICFSPRNEFHILVPADLFGAIEPSEHLPQIFGAIAFWIADGFATVDLSVYTHTSLIRLSNTVDALSGLYKIPLSYDELMGKNIGEIKSLATSPRSVNDLIARSDLLPNRDLAILYTKVRDRVVSKEKK